MSADGEPNEDHITIDLDAGTHAGTRKLGDMLRDPEYRASLEEAAGASRESLMRTIKSIPTMNPAGNPPLRIADLHPPPPNPAHTTNALLARYIEDQEALSVARKADNDEARELARRSLRWTRINTVALVVLSVAGLLVALLHH